MCIVSMRNFCDRTGFLRSKVYLFTDPPCTHEGVCLFMASLLLPENISWEISTNYYHGLQFLVRGDGRCMELGAAKSIYNNRFKLRSMINCVLPSIVFRRSCLLIGIMVKSIMNY